MGAGAKTRWHQLDNAIGRSGLSACDRGTFRCLLGDSNYATAELAARFTPTQKEIARDIGFTVRQVRRSLRHLERHGWLTVYGTAGGRGNTRRYVLALGSACDCTGRVHETRHETGAAALIPAVAQGLARDLVAASVSAAVSALAGLPPEAVLKADTGLKADMMSAFRGLKADTEGGHAAGQRPVCTGSQKGEEAGQQFFHDQQALALRNGDPVSCPFCGADGVVGQRLIKHEPDCWRGGMLALYDREPGS
jgi:hypothetical protein